MAIFNKKVEITPTYIFFHFLHVSSRFFASGKVQTISSRFFAFPPLSIFFHFLPTPIWFSGVGTALPYYFLLFCFPSATLPVLLSSILFSFCRATFYIVEEDFLLFLFVWNRFLHSFRRTTFYAMFFSLCLSMMCFYHWFRV